MSTLSRWLGWPKQARTSRQFRQEGAAAKPQTVRRVILSLEELEDRAMPSLLGQQLFRADYPWNQNIANAPVVANSAAIMAHIGNSIGIHADWGESSSANVNAPLYGIPYNVVHGNSPLVSKVNVVIDNYPGESDIVAVPMPANPVLEGDYQNGPNLNGGGYNAGQRGDSHLIIWDVDNNIAYELYGVTRPTEAFLFPTDNGDYLPHTDGKWHAAQESVWDMKANTFRSLGYTSADAAGLSILAGLVRPDEGLPVAQGGQGTINHALRFTLPSRDVNPQYIYPASHVVNVTSGSTNLPFGSRLRLANTTAVNAVINTLGPEAQIIARAMQQYGLVLADIGSAMYVTGTSAAQDANNNISLTWNMDDVLGLSALKASYFEVVDLTPRVTGLSTTSGSAGTTVTITGQNFSGSAGHLTVLFGNMAASSVTYVDDSHFTATVPNGSGTVHVRVQSGINQADPNSPSHNVQNPIFGYGTSTTSAADQFTYNGATISGAFSTVSFASSTVSSGASNKITIVVKDTNNATVSGLTSGAFGFVLTGGTSAGTFGAVTETATLGTYTANFTGTTVGTASSLNATVSGIALTTHPTITVTASTAPTVTVNPSNRTIATGGSTTFTAAANPGTPSATSVQWQVSVYGSTTWTNLSNGGGYSGVATGTLTIAGASTALNGNRYRVVFSNAAPSSAASTAATLIVTSAYAYAANINAYYGYVYAYNAYVANPQSAYAYFAYINAYNGFVYAQAAYNLNLQGNQSASNRNADLAAQYENLAQSYALADYNSTKNVYSYYAYVYALRGYSYSIYTSLGA